MSSNINALKSRIKVIGETAQITNAMKMISMAKYYKINEKYEKNDHYQDKVRATIKTILKESGEIDHAYFAKRERKNSTYVVIASDTGLAGDYNHRVLNFAESTILDAENDTRIFTIGYMAYEFFEKSMLNPEGEFLFSAQNPSIDDAARITSVLIDLFDSGATDEVNIIFTTDDGNATSAVMQRLLPLSRRMFLNEEINEFAGITFEPSMKELFDILVPQYVLSAVYTALIESVKCEHIERMVTMSGSTKNAEEMLEKLKLEYNRSRQEQITTEIAEITAAVAEEYDGD
ncbi:MAG: ATP synthase F1 subunit gamma [Clostridia bacterium]